MSNKPLNNSVFELAIKLLHAARTHVIRQVNVTMVRTYFEIGRLIIEDEQQGKSRAEYGKGLIKELSGRLTSEFGKGFSLRNVQKMRQFYVIYSKAQTVSALSETNKLTSSSEFKLSWSHYLHLMRIDDENERKFGL